MAVGEFQVLLELDGELGAVGAPRAVIRCDIGAELRGAVVLRVQEREHLNLHGIGAVVVGAGRIEADDLVGGADGDSGAAVLRAAAAVFHAAACG